MTITRWEYAQVVWMDVKRKITKADTEYARLPADERARWEREGWAFYWWREQTFYIWLPGSAKADIRVAWSTGDPNHKANGQDIMNELGRNGWELVTSATVYTAMDSNIFGWETVGYPIQTHARFKRPITD